MVAISLPFVWIGVAMTIKRLLLASIVSQCLAASGTIEARDDIVAPDNNSAHEGKTPKGWTALFNGRDLSGWVVEGTTENKKSGETKPVWSVADGLLHCEGSGFGFLRYDRELCDFTLHVEYRLTNISRAEPASDLYTVPSDYTIVDGLSPRRPE